MNNFGNHIGAAALHDAGARLWRAARPARSWSAAALCRFSVERLLAGRFLRPIHFPLPVVVGYGSSHLLESAVKFLGRENQILLVDCAGRNLAQTKMKPKDIFGLIIRLVGLIFVYESAEKVPLAFAAIFPGFKTISWIGFLSALFMVVWPLVVAYWMLRGAPPISRLAYPEDSK